MIFFPTSMPALMIGFHNRWSAIIVPGNTNGANNSIFESLWLNATAVNVCIAATLPTNKYNNVRVTLTQMVELEKGDKRTYWRMADDITKTIKT